LDTRSTLAIIIVNWNRRDDLLQLQMDLAAQTEPADEILVIDNGSTDGSTDALAAGSHSARIIRLHRNTGLSFGRNVGIASSKSDLLVFLDNDMRVLDTRFLARARDSAAAHSDCGIISFHYFNVVPTRTLNPAEPRPPSLADLVRIAAIGGSPVRPRTFYDWFFWGGASLVRRSVFQEVGVFDDVFSYGGEEWDLAFRCHAAGIRLLRDTSLWTVHMQSPIMRSSAMPSQILRNMVLAEARYMPSADLVAMLLMQFAASLADAVRQKSLLACVRDWFSIGASWWSRVVRKRNPVSRSVMRRFYFLRLANEPDAFASVLNSRVSIIGYYRERHRIRRHCRSQDVVTIA